VVFTEGPKILFCEELANVGEGLEFQGVTGGIEEKHRGLFADLTLEANIGFDDEVGAGFAEAVGEGLPLGYGKNDAEVRDGDVVTVDRIVVGLVAVGGGFECATIWWPKRSKSIQWAELRPSGQPRVVP